MFRCSGVQVFRCLGVQVFRVWGLGFGVWGLGSRRRSTLVYLGWHGLACALHC